MIRRYATVGAKLDDEDVAAAVFLRDHINWRPADLGYPAGDYILWDLTSEIDRALATRANA